MLTTSKLTVGGMDVTAIHGLSSKSPVIYGTTTEGVFADFIESDEDRPSKGVSVFRQLTCEESSSFHKMIVMGYHPFEALQAVLDLKKPGFGSFKNLRELEAWLDDVETSKREQQDLDFWTSMLRNSRVTTTNGKVKDSFNHPLWEDRDDPSY